MVVLWVIPSCAKTLTISIGESVNLSADVYLGANSWIESIKQNIIGDAVKLTSGSSLHRTASGYKEGSSTVSCDVTIKIKGVGNNYTYSTQNFCWTIYVEAAKVKSIVLSPSNLDIKIGESLQVTANVSPSNAKVNNYSWSTTITKILQVSGNGKIATITGLAVGEAEVICTTDNGTKGTCKVRVIKDPTAISLPNELYFVKGKQYTYYPNIYPIRCMEQNNMEQQ